MTPIVTKFITSTITGYSMQKFLILIMLVSSHCLAEPVTSGCTDGMFKEHGLRVRGEVTSHIKYPRQAVHEEMSGEGEVSFSYSNADRTPRNITIVRSTGYVLLDDEMVNAVKLSVLPIAECDNEGEVYNINAPIIFSLPGPTVEKPEKKSSPRPPPIPLHESTG